MKNSIIYSTCSYVPLNLNNSTSVAVVSPKPSGSSHQPLEPVFDDDYIVMDPLYVEPPTEDDFTDGNADTLKAEKTSES